MLQAKTFWQIRVTCRKPLIINELGMMLLVALSKSMNYWRWHHKGTNSKSHLSALTFQKSCLFVNEWTYEPIHYLSESRWPLSTIFRIPVNLAFSLPLPAIKWDRLIIAPMCRHSSLTLMHTHSQMQTLFWLMTALNVIVQPKRLCKCISLKQADVFGFLAWHNHSIKKSLLLGPNQAKPGNILLLKKHAQW